MKSKYLAALPGIILMAMSLLMAVHLHYRTPHFPYSPDSAPYIEQARDLIQNVSLSNLDQAQYNVFPIGFPIVLAAISTFGFDAKDVAIEIGHLSAILLPWLLYACFRNALGSRTALMLAGLSLTSPGILLNSPYGLTDIFSLALAVAAISLTLNAKSNLGFIFGGILAGMAYAVRNAHLALLLSIGLYFVYLYFIDKQTNRRTLYQNAASQFLGIVIIVFPILIRNVSLFGTTSPYKMAPSSISFIENLRTYIQALIKDVTACSECANYIAWTVPGLLALILIVSCLYCLFSKYVWSDLEATIKKTIVLSGIYTLAGSAIVILARTRYQYQYSPHFAIYAFFTGNFTYAGFKR